MFKAVKSHILPQPSGAQALSLVFVRDLAEAVVACLTHPAAGGKDLLRRGAGKLSRRVSWPRRLPHR